MKLIVAVAFLGAANAAAVEAEKKEARRLSEAAFDAACTKGGAVYDTLDAIYGEELHDCLCDNNLLTAESTSSPNVAEWCTCKDAMKASTLLKSSAGVTDAQLDDACGGGSDPCFARETFALGANGESVPMASLKSGDLVMDGPNSFTRVIVNQHREATFKSGLLLLEHANGELSLTPDHVLEVDGAFVPARLASAGSKLGESEVSRVTAAAGEVINPLTTSGKILTQGGVLATTYPEWIAEYMLSSYLVPLPVSLSNAISYLFPETTQAYYDALIEPLVTKAHPKHLKAALPSSLLPVAFLAGDLALTSGFLGFALASPMVVLVVVAAAVAAKARK